jgi:hypothetical protein
VLHGVANNARQCNPQVQRHVVDDSLRAVAGHAAHLVVGVVVGAAEAFLDRLFVRV